MSSAANGPLLRFLVTLLLLLHITTFVNAISVNYGTIADNLPPPAQVANFIKSKTLIDGVKIFDMNPDIIRAFANTGIPLSVTIPNGDIPALANPRAARRWVNTNIAPFVPATNIKYVLVGSEVLHWGTPDIISQLVPAMKSVQKGLAKSGFNIKVTTAHSLGILQTSTPPSRASFWPHLANPVLIPMLQFHRRTKTPFMFNPYPYFNFNPKMQDYVLGRPNNPGVFDGVTKIKYNNMFTELIDSTYSAMKAVGFGDVQIALGETGWPSAGDPGMDWCNVNNALQHNTLVRKIVESGNGTPLLPNRKFDTFIFGLFNENQKPGSAAERNFGLFRPDFTPVYDIGIMSNGQPAKRGNTPVPVAPGNTPVPEGPVPLASGKKWCVAKPTATDQQLQSNIDWGCGQGVDCSKIQVGGPCLEPNTVKSHASYVMNTYYRNNGGNDLNCNFAGTGLISNADPSYGACKYV
ncbi:hypothetical protein ACFE04_030772 [Oxalis oulophora]